MSEEPKPLSDPPLGRIYCHLCERQRAIGEKHTCLVPAPPERMPQPPPAPVREGYAVRQVEGGTLVLTSHGYNPENPAQPTPAPKRRRRKSP